MEQPTAERPSYFPPSVLKSRKKWDVFLTFRGADTRDALTLPLYHALLAAGDGGRVRVFMDDEGLDRGEDIPAGLLEAIVDSAAAVAVISPKYAESRWCLEELSRIIDNGILVVPVFYGVDPSDVRWQRGVHFEEAFEKHREKRGIEKVLKWKNALYNVGNKAGFPFVESRDDKDHLIRSVVKRVVKELNRTPQDMSDCTVGLHTRVDAVITRLSLQSKGVRVLVIHGTPGIGKTTVAKAAFNKLVTHFKTRSFISNFTEKMANEGLLGIQKKLIRDLSEENHTLAVENENAGKRMIRRIVYERPVLIVLDDVSTADQLESLGIDKGQFCDGSRIVITSRNAQVLDAGTHIEFYEVQRLSQEESLELFSYYSLGRRIPQASEFSPISQEIVRLTQGLPLALEVFGSFLLKRTRKEWEESLKKLRQIRPSELQDVLKISFEGLHDQEKCIFLDIACLFLRTMMKRGDVIDILEGCGFEAPELAIGNLVAKSLVKITEDSELWMHDQIRDMGSQIVIEGSIHDPGNRSRLWEFDDIWKVLKYKKGTGLVRGIVLDLESKRLAEDLTSAMIARTNFERHPNITNGIIYVREKFRECIGYAEDEGEKTILCTESFEPLANLKLLQINHVKLEGDFKYMPTELKWLQWKGCARKSLPCNIPQEITVLDLSKSKIECLWGWRWPRFRKKVAENLLVINLYGCSNLTTLPDLSGHQRLKKLILERCVRLRELPGSVGNMSSLVHLNLRDCNDLIEFPRDVTGLKNLEELILSGCYKLTTLPNDVRSLKSLTRLFADGTAITELPGYLFRLTQLELLSLNACRELHNIPEWLGKLGSLRELYLDASPIRELPESMGSLSSLETLSLVRCTSLASIPDSVGNLTSLVNLSLNHSSVEHLPASICKLSYLKVLSLGYCTSLRALPLTMGGLASLVELQLDNASVPEIPGEIGCLKFIQKLEIRNCPHVTSLPESIGGMSSLSILFIRGTPIMELPESLSNLDELTWLNLNKCQQLCKLPDSFGRLKSLCQLEIEETSVTELPESFGLLEHLMVLKMKKTHRDLDVPETLMEPFRPVSLPTSFSNLTRLEELDARAWKISYPIPDDFNQLSSLTILNLGYNNFETLPSDLRGLSVLQRLLLNHCEKLKSVPSLPESVREVNAADCYKLEHICDVSCLVRLQELELSNCERLVDVPGLECLISLRRLYMGGCNLGTLSVGRRLGRVALRSLNSLSIPGGQIPTWFMQDVVYSRHPNLAIKNVIVGVVVSVNLLRLDAIRAHVPTLVGVQAKIMRLSATIFCTTLDLKGVPRTSEDQLYLCRFKEYHPLVSMLRDGDTIQVAKQFPGDEGIELKRWGVCLVYENDDDYDGEEPGEESQQSVSERLRSFFHNLSLA